MRIIRLLFAAAFLFSAVSTIASEKKDNSHIIDWKPVFENRFSESSVFRSLYFTGAALDENFLPRYTIKEALPGPASAITARLKNIVTAKLEESDVITNPEKVGADFLVTANIACEKKSYYSSVSVLPVRRTSAGFEKLLSFEIDISATPSTRSAASLRTYTTTSVLSTGDWYKFGVVQNGVHKISYQFLKNLGIDIDDIDPRSIAIYGNGGGQLPYANATFRYDDLQENSIIINGESDGKFDESDYILFFGSSQTKVVFDSSISKFVHQANNYADTTYYFLTTGRTNPKRIQTELSSQLTPNITVNTFDDLGHHEQDSYNLLKSGREWFGETIDNINNSYSFNHNLNNLVAGDSIFVRINLLGRATGSINHTDNYFKLFINGSNVVTQRWNDVGINSQDNFGNYVSLNHAMVLSGSNLSIMIQITSSDPTAQGWLNFSEVNVRRNLTASNGNQFVFRDLRSKGIGNVSQFNVSNVSGNLYVWDITDPLNPRIQENSVSGNTLSFTRQTDQLLTFIGYDGVNLPSPTNGKTVMNQNLHGLASATMLIITHPLFLTQAAELADFHRTHDNMSVIVATTPQIFNEFSSGAQDVSGLRDFIKMFYDRADSTGILPKHVLLFGDASYDNKYRTQSNTNFVTSYQSPESTNQTQTYISDDFFVLLDDIEGSWVTGEIPDMGIGRLCVKSITEAQAAVNKIKHYVTGAPSSVNNTMGNWRNVISFVGDDQDSNTHFRQADTLANRVWNGYPLYNVDKIYLDAYNQISTPGGQRYPDARNAIVDRVQRGSLLLTYIGHGGEVGWAHERVLENDDINDWTNFDKMPAFLTATCEFTRVDDPGRTSAGELVFLNPNGGGICMFTTSRLAFSSSNYGLCQRFFQHFLEKQNGEYLTTGEIFQKTKADVYSDRYVRNFLLIGDPAVRLAYPEYNVVSKTINGVAVGQGTDTLKALSKVTITGEVHDHTGNIMSSFNGIIYPTVYDKRMVYYTLGNDRFVVLDPSTAQPFALQKNIIYSGKASVTNGQFSFSFVVPKDISFHYGNAKLSYYAQNGSVDANGSDTTVIVGGLNENAIADGEGPQIKLYMNDEKFVRGGMTDKNPVLYAIVSDSSGINTVGTGIGHDMTAEMDSKSDKRYVLNDYYENDLNSYQKGQVRYQFKNLTPGPHTLDFKVWDVFNNSSQASTDFIVSESAKLALDHVLNYPNPFTTHTTFMFEHNRPYVMLNVQVQIFTVSGRLIKTLASTVNSTGYRSDDIEWDGLDDFGDKIGRGVYVYKLRVKAADGEYADKFEKLVILR
jgi:hypothetical protein